MQLAMSRLGIALWALLACLTGSVWAQSRGRFVWELIEPAAGSPRPGARNNAFVGWLPKSQVLVLFGGTTAATGRSAADTWLFFPSNRTWLQVPTTTAPDARNSGAYGTYTADDGRELFVIASGTRSKADTLNDIWEFSVVTLTWTRLPNNGDVPESRYGAAFGIHPGTQLFYLSHGFSKVRYSDTYYYDLRARRWTKLHGGTNPYNPAAPHARCLIQGAMPTPTRLTLYGGCMQVGFTGGPCPARDGWSLNFQVANTSVDGVATQAARSASWHKLDDGPSPRTRPGLTRLPRAWALNPNAVLLLGGEERGKQTISVARASNFDLDLVDTATGKWFQAFAVPATQGGPMPTMRASLALAVDDTGGASDRYAGGRIFMFGGTLQRSPGGDTDELWQLTYWPNLPDAATLASAPGRVLPAGIQPRKQPSSWFSYPHLHGLFMGLSWGILLPTGVLMARHLRHKDPLWFKLHRACQMVGTLFSVLGLIFVVVGGAVNPAFAHGIIGIIVVLLGLLQPINAYFRPHKGMKWRRHWEVLHKGSGRLAVLLGLVNVSLGTFLVVGPTGLIIAWHVILGVMLAIAVALEVRLWMARRRAARDGTDLGPHVPMGTMGPHAGLACMPTTPHGTPLHATVEATVTLAHDQARGAPADKHGLLMVGAKGAGPPSPHPNSPHLTSPTLRRP